MTARIIDAAVTNLRRAEALVERLEPEAYANADLAPYYSSIGSHLRHILDIFSCLSRGIETGTVDLTDRVRGTACESDPDAGLAYLHQVIDQLQALRGIAADRPVLVADDLGLGKQAVPYTVAAALCQTHSHAIHHFACIGYLLNLQGIPLPAEGFGLNPTTPLQSAN